MRTSKNLTNLNGFDSPTSLPDHQPGITYDGQLRLFRLRCKGALYAFRVDDARNLEHLYWGPPLPEDDDITYLIRSHMATPFDPKGSIDASIGTALGLEELNRINSLETVTDRWKHYRDTMHASPAPISEDYLRNRRLENASWRIWHQQKRQTTLAEQKRATERFIQFNSSEETLRQKTMNKKEGLKTTRSFSNFASLAASEDDIDDHKRSLREFLPSSSRSHIEVGSLAGANTSTASIAGASGASPGLTKTIMSMRSFNYGLSVGSLTDLGAQEQNTNWGALDPEELGKNTKLLEFSDQGTGDYREASFKVVFSKDGSSVCPLQYKKHKIIAGKIPITPPLPHVYTERTEEATTLVVEMEDRLSGLRFLLYYTVMHDYGIITRRTVAVNDGKEPLTLRHLVSGTFDFDAASDFYMTQLAGGWARERDIVCQKLDYGIKEIKSTRGASSHQFNPFIVVTPGAEPEEESGECFGFAFVYSGNFSAKCEVTEFGRLRVNFGLNPDGFIWELEARGGENTFSTPEVVMSYSGQGMGGLSRQLHKAFRERLMPRQWRGRIPPVLINTWEAAYFNVTHEVVVEIAQAARRANIELLVLDDGWFGQRDNTNSGLGDWFPNKSKFPFGVDGIARAVNASGLKFGIWVEPEMISQDSELYRAHPDWCLCVPMRNRTTGRNQLVLDLSRQVVRDHIYDQLYRLFSSANIEYVKWDMNRHLTEVFSQEWDSRRQGEISHRFMLGLYELLGRLTEAFPNILFETCSGGGGRFDAGMLYFAPQIWTSDNTDALSRTCIQYGTSLAYPASCMGAHVSAVPNHQTLRSTPMKTRSVVAMSGTFGYELDPRGLTDTDIQDIRQYIALQKKMAPLVYNGDMFRLWSPFKTNSAAWMFVSTDQKWAMVIAVNIRRIVGRLLPRLKLRGLRDDWRYHVEELFPGTVVRNQDTGAIEHTQFGVYQYEKTGLSMTGRTLHNAGLPIKFMFDSDSVLLELKAKPESGHRNHQNHDLDHHHVHFSDLTI